MKTCPKPFQRAFTLVELIVVVAVVVLIASMVVPPKRVHYRSIASRISCVNNLKEVGIAYRIWAGDNGDMVPAQQTVLSNGWKDALTNVNAGSKCWMNYAIMANDMGQAPRLVLCPSDERQPAENFTNHFGNTNISYFVGVGANNIYPQSIIGGDRNVAPGTTPHADYGYSPADGRGNDVAIPTSAAVSWSLKMHSTDNNKTAGAGNILLGDGSSQQVSSANLTQNWLRNAADSGNWPTGHVPAKSSVRWVFP